MNACYLIFQKSMLMPIIKIEDQNVFFHIELLSLMKVDNFKIEDLKDLDASDVLS